LQELSSQTGIDKDGILQTVQRWNTMCAAGVDIEFGKGSNEYQRYFGDPKRKSNPTMGTIKRSPFYALPIWPGDAGTKGGLLTDEYARVLRDDASILPGLYAAGNTAASIMGESSIGAGVTLGPAMTFAYIAARHLAAGSQVVSSNDTKPAEDCSAGDMKKDGAALSPSTV
jgi:3-oxosteroid 1-dehydrogenase